MQTYLIGGTSHCGKSTLAAALAIKLGGNLIATDSLARHPGRPWPNVKPHVAEYYRNLSSDSIYQFLIALYHNMQPALTRIISDQLKVTAAKPLVLEGSAIRPGWVSELRKRLPHTSRQSLSCCWLTASETEITERIHYGSDYRRLPSVQATLVDAFTTRSIADNNALVREARELGLRVIETPTIPRSMSLADALLAML